MYNDYFETIHSINLPLFKEDGAVKKGNYLGIQPKYSDESYVGIGIDQLISYACLMRSKNSTYQQ